MLRVAIETQKFRRVNEIVRLTTEEAAGEIEVTVNLSATEIVNMIFVCETKNPTVSVGVMPASA
jgi:hypothetical protein